MRKLAGNRRKNPQIETLGGRAQNRGAAGVADFDIPGDKARHQDGRAFNEHDARLDPLLREQSLLLGDKERNRPRAHGRDPDGDFGLGPDSGCLNCDQQENTRSKATHNLPAIFFLLLSKWLRVRSERPVN